MDKEIDMNLSTIIDLFNKILENKKLYLKTKDIDLEYLANKYIFISDLVKEISKENYICIYYDCDNKVCKKRLEQFIILLKGIRCKYNKAKNIIEAITYKGSDNISLMEMSNILFRQNIEDYNVEIIYERLKNSNYSIYDYWWINNFIDNIKDSKIINYYLKYRKFDNRDKFNDLYDNISYNEITNVQYKLDCLLNNKYALIPPIYINNFTNYFISSKFSLDISEGELLNYISNLTIDNNNEMKELKWYHYLNRKKYTEIRHYNRDILNKYETIKKTIFNQYKENIESLTMYVKSFDFLKPVIKESYFNKIYECLYDENEMFTFLKNISNTLSLYKSFLSIINQINKLSDQELELLNLCYNKNDTISKYKKKLFILPSILILYSFQSYEETLSKSDIKKDTLDTLITQLKNDLDMLSKLFFNNNFDLLSYIKIVEDVSKIEEAESTTSYILKKVEYDDCTRYIDETLESNLDNFEISSSNYEIIKFIKESITNLGYKIVQNFKLDLINLELIVFNPNDPNLIVYIFIDSMVISSYDTIRKLSYIKGRNIPIVYCWSDEFFINRNLEILKLKTKLKNLLS